MTHASRKKVRVLSIDGGGIRGILPGVILRRVEEKLITASNGEIKRIADAFDLIAGTSTGGILACAYLIPEKIGSQTPKFTAQQAVDLYLERGDDIFDVSFKQKLKSLGGVIDEKYGADELEDALKDNFGDTKLKDLLKPCIITSYDIRNRNAFFFRKQRANDKENNFLVRDVARATSAAPTYFETARVKNDLGSPFPLIDGGVFVNNPALCAYSEARNLNFPERGINKPTAKDMVIVSIGTGSIKKSYEYKKAKNWGLVEWIQPIIDIMMSGNSETVDYHLKQIYDTLPTSDKTDYYRLEPQLGTASSDMDDASVENLKALEAAGQDFVQDDENDKTLTEIVNKLL
ncbi:MAG: patatin-like phospholipase family protein [Bacteroidota bacterium]